MGASSIRAGVHVAINGENHKLLRKLDDCTWQLENAKSLRIKELQTKTLRQLYEEGSLVFASSDFSIAASGSGQKISNISDHQWARAKVKRAYVVAVLSFPSTANAIVFAVQQVWEKIGTKDPCPSASSVLKWKRRYVESGQDLTSLVDQPHRKGNRSSRYPQETINLVNDVIDEIYMSLERETYQEVLNQSVTRIKRENKLRPRQIHLRRPTFRLVKRLIKEIPAFDRCAARYGRTVAMNRFRSVQCHLVADLPLERAEIDHSPLDLIVIDDDTFMPLGRPWLTVCLDVRTRCVLGLYLGFEPPSHLSVAACLRDAFLPKIDLRKDYPSIKNEWVAHGVMSELVVDNGSEFHSESLENACLSFGTEIHYCERRTPWHKGKVERFIKTLNFDLSHGIPGTTFSNILEKGDYDPSKYAVVRLSMIQEIVRKWVADMYHQKQHRATGLPPVLDWTSSISDEDISLPDDPTVLDAILGRTETRQLTHKGIELDCLFYNSPEMSDLRKRYGENFAVQLRIDDSNIGEIIVVCPKTGDLYRVPALYSDYASGLSRWQHGVCKRYARQRFDAKDWESWLDAKDEIRQMVRDEFLTKTKGTRSRAARFKNAGKPSDPANDKPIETQTDTVDTLDSKQPSTRQIPTADTQTCDVIDFKPISVVYRDRGVPDEEAV